MQLFIQTDVSQPIHALGRKRRCDIRFQADTPPPDSLKINNPAKKMSLRDRISLWTTYLSIGLGISSGACLIGSGTLGLVEFLSGKPSLKSHAADISANMPVIQAPSVMQQWRQLLQETGGALVAISYLTGCIGEIGASIKSGQPNYALGNMLYIPLALPVVASTLISVMPQAAQNTITQHGIVSKETVKWGLDMSKETWYRALTLVFLGTIYAGYANVIQNRYDPTCKNQKRSCDLERLLDPQHWQSAWNDPQQRKDLLAEAKKVTQYMVEDHVLLLQSIKNAPQQVRQTLTNLKNALAAVRAGKAISIPAQHQVTRFSAMTYYLGGILLMATGNPIASVISGLGCVGSGLENFSIGTQRKDWIGKALMAGTPMQWVGSSAVQTDIGFGLRCLGEASAYTLTLDMFQSDDEAKKHLKSSDVPTTTSTAPPSEEPKST